ncbi:hypothetical protein BLL42_28480 (plasmid) [Pseudomonas frederiksbergensis]|uniref:Uncharacterized protein n=1 Tax=Pseudomonas frederiksbergensis TaxID=104087 RepID=A0A1J0EUK3_9PSED|nr:hypothetical protein BLL42_28480 [Pseudomonas frederiksbergensis]
MGCQIYLEGVTIRLDRDDRKALPKRKESLNIAHKNAGLLDIFARTNIISQIGVLVFVFPCSGLMIPDTHLGENTRQIEVSDDQATPYLFR